MLIFIIMWWCILGILACRILIVSNGIEIQKIMQMSGITDYKPKFSWYFVLTAYTMCAVLGPVLLAMVFDSIKDKHFKLWH